MVSRRLLGKHEIQIGQQKVKTKKQLYKSDRERKMTDYFTSYRMNTVPTDYPQQGRSFIIELRFEF